jgi:hypothetical protein
MERRTDRITALLVDAVLNGEAAHGIAHSARRLCEVGVPMHVAMRLLTRPGERRNYFGLPIRVTDR